MTGPSTQHSLLPGQRRLALEMLALLLVGFLLVNFLLVGFLLVGPAACDEPDQQQTEPATPEAARLQLKLPGLTVNAAERCVDIEAKVCLDKGPLELVACTKGSKEHESIVAVQAKPMHIHTALLVLGATNGHPAMRRPRGPAGTGWVDIPPSGDPIKVSLVFQDTDGKLAEHAISEFVAASDVASTGAPNRAAGDGGEVARFPDTFLFAGSHLHNNGDGPSMYLADESGHVISIATFGDELLCIDGMHAHANDALMWQINPEKLPPVGEQVTLRLRVRKPDVAPATADPPS